MAELARQLVVPVAGTRRPRLRLLEREGFLGYVLIAPAVLYILALVGYPFLLSLWFSVSDATPDAGATTVSVALLVPPPVSVAEMLGVAVTVNPSTLVTVKVAELVPETTVAVAGTVAAAVLLLARLTTTPPVGAVVFNVTVPVDVDAVPLG